MLLKLLICLAVLAVLRCVPYACRSTWAGPPVVLFAVAFLWAGRLAHPFTPWDAIAAILAVLSWPWVEAGFHKHLLHNRRKWLLPVKNHLAHHANPTAYNGLTPLFNAAQFVALAWLLQGFPIATTVLGVFLLLFFAYEVVHYGIHAGWAPRRIADHHMAHHHHPREKFGVTVPWL